jgi:plasmid replication initiation protein
MNLNTRFQEKGAIEVPAIGSNNKLLETDENNNELSSEQKPRNLFVDGSNTFEHTTPPAFKDLQKKYHFILNQQIDHDLLYRYEPYYIIEGWNYEEMYTPEPN